MTAVEHRFGPYGGQFVPETLMPALAALEAAWVQARADADPWAVDSASGTEQEPGIKDPEKVRRFLEIAAGTPVG